MGLAEWQWGAVGTGRTGRLEYLDFLGSPVGIFHLVGDVRLYRPGDIQPVLQTYLILLLQFGLDALRDKFTHSALGIGFNGKQTQRYGVLPSFFLYYGMVPETESSQLLTLQFRSLLGGEWGKKYSINRDFIAFRGAGGKTDLPSG